MAGPRKFDCESLNPTQRRILMLIEAVHDFPRRGIRPSTKLGRQWRLIWESVEEIIEDSLHSRRKKTLTVGELLELVA